MSVKLQSFYDRDGAGRSRNLPRRWMSLRGFEGVRAVSGGERRVAMPGMQSFMHGGRLTMMVLLVYQCVILMVAARMMVMTTTRNGDDDDDYNDEDGGDDDDNK